MSSSQHQYENDDDFGLVAVAYAIICLTSRGFPIVLVGGRVLEQTFETRGNVDVFCIAFLDEPPADPNEAQCFFQV